MRMLARVAVVLLLSASVLAACADRESIDATSRDSAASVTAADTSAEPTAASGKPTATDPPGMKSTSNDSSASAMTDSTRLIGPTWRLIQFSSEAPAADSLDEVEVTATFSAEGRVAGRGGCNRYSGPFDRSGDELTFGAQASTKMACMGPAMEVEKRFFNALRSVRRYEIRDRRLLLFDENDTRVLLFATDEASGENAPG